MNNISEDKINRKLSFKEVSSVDVLYKSLHDNSPLNDEAIIIIKLLSWVNSVLRFDPFSDKPINSDIDSFLLRISEYCNSSDKVVKDTVYHLVEFISKELDYLLKNMRQKILRNHENMPLYSVRETDSKSLQILARKPGKTVREKLANQHYMVAVKRRFSSDTLENQLLKLFVSKLQELLFIRKECFDKVGFSSDDLASNFISKINFWKHSEEAESIGVWKNNPPNNVLLQDRRYRKVWIGWSMLRNIDYMLSDFSSNTYSQISNYVFWHLAMEFSRYDDVRIFQKPIIFSFSSLNKFKSKEEFHVFLSNTVSSNRSLDCFKDDNQIKIISENMEYLFVFDDGAISIRETFSQKQMTVLIKSSEFWAFPKEFVKSLLDYLGASKLQEKCVTDCLCSGNKVAIDLSYTYPIYSDGVSIAQFHDRIMVQSWMSKTEHDLVYKINNKFSKGIILKDPNYDVETNTLKSVLSAKDIGHNEKLKLIDASIQLFQIIKEELSVDKLIYAVPDIVDDFDVEPIRIGINSSFNSSSPVPVSIAVCEDSIQQGIFKSFESGDLIIVVDSYVDGIAFTPVLTAFDKALLKDIPETKGIQFIRYPSVFCQHKNYIETFTDLECSDSLRERLSKLYGIDAIFKGLNGNSYYVDSYEHPFIEKKQIRNLYVEEEHLDLVKRSIEKIVKYKKIHVLSNKKYISLDHIQNLPEIMTVYACKSTAKGIYAVDDIESKLADNSLWFDYLPELKMEAVVNGKKELLSLVRDKKIKPQLNVSVPVKVSWSFTLPANKKFYHFPLVQGDGNKNLCYEAFIESDVFPLDDNLDCSLELTYTYGAERPYKLSFVPKRNIGEAKLNVQWKLKSEIPIDYDSLPVPPFPQKKTEEYYRHYPPKNKDNVSEDMVEWFSKNIDIMKRLIIHTDCKVFNEKQWTSKNGKQMNSFYIKDGNGAEFQYVVPCEKCKEEKIDDIKTSKIMYVDYGVERQKPRPYTYKDLKKIRFPMYALFNDGLKISDFNEEFYNKCKSFINFTANMISEKKQSSEYINECVFYTCSMTDELPKNIVSYIQKQDFSKKSAISNKLLSKVFRDCQFAWQKELLNLQISKLKNKNEQNNVLYIFSKSIWNNDRFILTLSEDNIRELSEVTVIRLTKAIDLLSKNKEDEEHLLSDIASYLELLLGLLRTRTIKNQSIKRLLAPSSDLNNRFIKQIEKLEKLCVSKQYSLKSFLEIQIDSQSFNQGIPPLLNVCKIFLLCEDESGSIRITGLELDSKEG